MLIEQIAKGTTGFLSILTKKWQLMMVMLFIGGGVGLTLLVRSDILPTTKFIIGSIVFVIGIALMWFLANLAQNEDERILRERQGYVTDMSMEQESHKSTLAEKAALQTTISEASAVIREWQRNSPPDNETGVYPYGNGVNLELKKTSNGVKYAILRVEGRPTKKFKLT